MRFCRDNRTGYYLNSASSKRLHRVVYEFYKGPIPDGFDIHHKDGDKANNDISNLELLERKEHHLLHGKNLSDERREWMRQNIIAKAVPAAREWHKTEEGHKWHVAHMKDCKNLHAHVRKICKYCGKEFEGTHNQFFCTNSCKQKWRYHHHIEDIETTCVICGKKFKTNKYKIARACSRECMCKLIWRIRKCA